MQQHPINRPKALKIVAQRLETMLSYTLSNTYNILLKHA